jgi:ABC-type nitrate/sulfonate/bicarbonate transport system substrate-binding protein
MRALFTSFTKDAFLGCDYFFSPPPLDDTHDSGEFHWLRPKHGNNPQSEIAFRNGYWDVEQENTDRGRCDRVLAVCRHQSVRGSKARYRNGGILHIRRVIVAMTTNRVGTAIFSKAEIKTMEELKGKVATGRPGAFLDAVVRYVLRSKCGFVPDRDVKPVALGWAGSLAPSAGAQRGGAAAMSMPYVFIARKSGLREFGQLRSTRHWVSLCERDDAKRNSEQKPELIENFLKCIIEGIYLFKTNRPRGLAVLKRYMRDASSEIVEETYQYTSGILNDIPQPSLQVVRGALEMLSAQYAQAKQTDPNLIVDASFMKRIEQSGFLEMLSKK